MLLKDLHEKQNNAKSLDEVFPTLDDRRNFFIQLYLNSNYRKVLYVHIPYCVKKCKYCVCNSVACSDYNQIYAYIDDVINQISDYQDVFAKINFEEVVFGGGTPTILNAPDLKKLFEAIPNFENIPTKIIEASPSTITDEHLLLLQEYKFSYISLGIQSTFRAVCEKQNRKFLNRIEIKSVADALRKSNIKFNFDLISFLYNGDIEDLKFTNIDLDFLLGECRPNYVTIHQLYSSQASIEKTRYLIKLIKEKLNKYNDYMCVNSNLSEEDYYQDTMYRAEYKLMLRTTDINFKTYMWNKYVHLPVLGYDILGIGHTDKVHVMSNAGNIQFVGGHLINFAFDPVVVENYAQNIISEIIERGEWKRQ